MSDSLSLVEAWNFLQENSTNSPKTKKFADYLWRSFLYPFYEDRKLREIDSLSVFRLKKQLENRKLSPKTIHHTLSHLRCVYNRMKRWNLYDGPIPYFDMPKFDNKRRRFLQPEETDRLFSALANRSQRWHDISVFALHSGLRSCEIFRLTPENIDFYYQFATVEDNKSGRLKMIPLNKIALEVIRKYYRRTSPFLFLSSRNGKICGVSKTYFRAVEDCGFNRAVTDRRQRVVFHTLRHTYASWLVLQETPIAAVSSLMGHQTIDMTMRYAHLHPTQGLAYVSSLEQYAVNVNL